MNDDLISRSALKEKLTSEFNDVARKAHFRLFTDVLRAKQAVLRSDGGCVYMDVVAGNELGKYI